MKLGNQDVIDIALVDLNWKICRVDIISIIGTKCITSCFIAVQANRRSGNICRDRHVVAGFSCHASEERFRAFSLLVVSLYVIYTDYYNTVDSDTSQH